MRWFAFTLAGLSWFVTVIVILVAMNLTDYRQDLLPYGEISFAVHLACILLVVILETRAFLTKKKNGN